jgi:arylsulfatase A-like enzyme
MFKQVWKAAVAVAVAASPVLAAEQAGSPARRPNVILIVADDLGNRDLGVQGGTDIPTPNIDSIAKNGVRFANGYVTCPVCSPTRAGLLTGRYQQRFGHEFNPGPQLPEGFGLPLSETTIADAFKSAGYATGLVGKWHLGNKPEFQPTRRGFTEFYGFLGGAHPYLPPDQVADQPQGNPRRQQRRNKDGADAADAKPQAAEAKKAAAAKPAAGGASHRGIYRNDAEIEEKRYLTDAFGDEAVGFIDRHQKDPFLLYVAFNAVHLPAHATQQYLDRFPKLEGQRKVYAAQLSALDDAIGRVLAKVRDSKLEDDTLIVFTADNGGPKQNGSDNGIFNATKGTVYEGGVRVPLYVQWKGKLPAGAVREDLAATIDLFPTAAAAAGIPPKPDQKFDGVNLLPVARGEAGAKSHDALAWRFGPQWAIRQGQWKLARAASGPADRTNVPAPKLFDLAADPGETTDVSAAHPDLVRSLQAKYAEWDKQNRAPLWQPNWATKAAAAAN